MKVDSTFKGERDVREGMRQRSSWAGLKLPLYKGAPALTAGLCHAPITLSQNLTAFKYQVMKQSSIFNIF